MKISDSLLDRLVEAAREDDDEAWPDVGTVVAGRYRLERPLGRGGMGSVYEAVDGGGGRVAVKLLDARGAAARARFVREASMLAELRHPRIVRILEHGLDPLPFLVTELHRGETLAERLSRGPLAGDEAARLVAILAEALAVVHAKGLVHRDLKPGNVFLRMDPAGVPSVEHALLLDFGMARSVDDDDEITFAGSTLGTPGFIAPELARGEAATPAADVFALGALLVACLAPDERGPLRDLADCLSASDPAARPPDGRAVLSLCAEREAGRALALPVAPDWDAIQSLLDAADPAARVVGGELAERWFEAAGIFAVEGADDLARRLEDAGLPARAAVWHRRAARLSFERNDFVGLFARARESIRCGASPTEVGGLRLLEAQAAGWDNRARDAIAHAEAAMDRLAVGSIAWMRAATEVGVASSRIGDAARVAELAERVGAALDAHAPRWIVVSVARLVTALSVVGHSQRARALCDRLELLADATAVRDPLVSGKVALARSVCALFDGDLETHATLLEQAVACADRAGDVRTSLHDRTNLGFALVELGDLDRAEPLLVATIADAGNKGLRFIEALGQKNLAMLRFEQGRFAEAAGHAAAVVAAARGNPRLASVAGAYEAFAAIAEGDVSRGRAAGQAALTVAPGDPERARALAAILEGDVACGDDVGAWARSAMLRPILARVATIDGGEARTYLALAAALDRVGEASGAREVLEAGRARLRTRARRIRDPGARARFERLRDHERLLRA